MSELCARHLLPQAGKVLLTNRTQAKAEALSQELGGRPQVRPFDKLGELLVEADIIISSTAAPRPLFAKDNVGASLKARKGRPLFLVDLAVPRDVDPSVNELDNVFAYDVDDLDRVVAENLAQRAGEAERAGVIVAEEVGRFMRARAAREAVPILATLRAHAEEIARSEAEKTLSNIGNVLNDKQRKSVEAMARAIVNKLLHEPTARLREAGEAGPEQAARLGQAAAELFGLGSTPPAAEAEPEPAAPVNEDEPIKRAQGGT
jgi:glutamyl-tRNA reductase